MSLVDLLLSTIAALPSPRIEHWHAPATRSTHSANFTCFRTAFPLIVLAARSVAGCISLVFSPLRFPPLLLTFSVEYLPLLPQTCVYTKDPAWPCQRQAILVVAFPPSFSVSCACVHTPPGRGLVSLILSNSRLSAEPSSLVTRLS